MFPVSGAIGLHLRAGKKVFGWNPIGLVAFILRIFSLIVLEWLKGLIFSVGVGLYCFSDDLSKRNEWDRLFRSGKTGGTGDGVELSYEFAISDLCWIVRFSIEVPWRRSNIGDCRSSPRLIVGVRVLVLIDCSFSSANNECGDEVDVVGSNLDLAVYFTGFRMKD